MTEVERKEDFRPEEFIDWFKDEEDSEEDRKKKAAEEDAKKAESGICDIFGADDDERKRESPFAGMKRPFEMTEEELDEALKKANKNTYWEFGLYTEKKRRAGKGESFIYEKEGARIPVLSTYTNKMEREICGEPVAVSFGDLPETKNVNSIGNPNAVRYTTHLEIHFDITEGAETKEGKSVAYMKAQSFLAAAYRGDTLGGKPVRRFRLNNMSEEELKAWGEVRAAFEGQGKKIEFILTDEQQKVFDRYAAKFAEITKLNRELVSGVKEDEKTKETPRVFKDVDDKEYDDITRIPEGAVFDELDLSGMDFTKLPEVLATCTVKNFVLYDCNNLTSLEGSPEGVEEFHCGNCDSLSSLKGCPKSVKELWCNNNLKLTSLEGSPEGVEEFHCENCDSLSSLKGCPKSVKKLWCGNNLKLTSLEGLPEGLEYISLGGCANVTSLEGLPKGLKKLVCARTGITSLKGCPEEVKELFCGGCVSLTSFEGCPEGIERINCVSCDKLEKIPDYIPDEAIEGLSKEKIAECKKNWVDGKEYDDITRIPEGAVFDKLDLSGMDFTKLPEVLATCTVKNFVLHDCNNLTSLEGCPKGIERFSCNFCDSLTSLEGSPEGVKEFHCENCDSLSSLKGCPKSVKELWCSDNLKLTSLEGLPEGLEYINLEACANVTSLEGLPKGLEKLVCANTGITSLKGCPEEVKELFCGGCVSLTSFEGCPKGLKLLDLYQSPSLTSLKGIPEGIEEIYLRKCYNLTSLEGCPKSVKRIDCSETDITSLDGCPKDIERINCANCDKLVRIPSYIPDEAIEGLSKEKIAECKKNWIATTSLLKRRGLGGYGG